MRPQLICLLAVICLFSGLQAQDWPQWHGAEANGLVADSLLGRSGIQSVKQVWQFEAGTGHASPVSMGSAGYLFSRMQDQEVLTAFEIGSGKKQWQVKASAAFSSNQYATSHGAGPFATPLITGEHIITFGVNGVLTCFDRNSGKQHWRHAFTEGTVNTARDFCGTSASPLQVGNSIIAMMGDDDAGRIISVDLKSGKINWQWQGDKPGYAMPVLYKASSGDQVIFLTMTKVVALEPQSGDLLWQMDYVSRYKENIVKPVIYDGMIIIAGTERPMLALKPVRKSDSWQVETVWKNQDAVIYMNAPVLMDGQIYGLAKKKKGQFFSLRASDGKIVWRSAGRQGRQASIFASPERLLTLNTGAELKISQLSEKSIAEAPAIQVADSEVWAMPILLPDGMIVKSRNHLQRLAYQYE